MPADGPVAVKSATDEPYPGGSVHSGANYAGLNYPMNVYATLLELGAGRNGLVGEGYRGALHFGLYPGPGNTTEALSFVQAQLLASDQIVTRLPPPPATILEVGCGSGELALRLSRAGYRVDAIDNSPAEIKLARLASRGSAQERTSDELAPEYHDVSIENYASQRRYDAIVLQDSVQHLDFLILAGKLRELLSPTGQVLVTDEFVIDDEDEFQLRLAPRSSFVQLMERCGFELETEVDLTERILPCFAVYRELFATFGQSAAELADVPVEQVSSLGRELARSFVRHQCGQLGYRLMGFRQRNEADPDLSPGEAIPLYGNIKSFAPEEVAGLFEKSFGQPFDSALWKWKYGNGRGRAVCAKVGGRVVAHYGGTPRDILYFGEPRKAIQICDVMVLPEKREFYSRKGLFFKTAATFLEREVGYSAEHLLGFGFPNAKVMHVAERLGLYSKTDEFVEVAFPPPPASAAEVGKPLQVSSVDIHDAQLRKEADFLWAQMSSAVGASPSIEGVIGLRDAAYLAYRYGDHPGDHYEVFCARSVAESVSLGLAVIRKHEDRYLLMDVVAAPEHLASVIDALNVELATREDYGGLACWITRRWSAEIRLPGSELRQLGIDIPCNTWSSGPPSKRLQGAWWLTAGDMDFI